ncbi:unnamed protein product [Anisakis simplex]|uniref:UDENN domain-containing protein n=1 Tax=Anisakis simplex TaxID=6269 RepID=A0A0M3JXC6_ANISI|nr:unnamed protein product [Anisakis simplex]
MNICYLAFPDSNSGCSRDTNFHFRIKRSSDYLNVSQIAYSERVPMCAEIDPLFFYGFVHFSDSCSACHHIDQWPSPAPGESLMLPLMGTVIQCRIPCRTDIPLTQPPLLLGVKKTSSQYAPVILSPVNEVNLFTNLFCVLNHVQLLWELVLTNETNAFYMFLNFLFKISRSIFPIAADRCNCSRSICMLISRTILDFTYLAFEVCFRHFDLVDRHTLPSVILGVTNPFFTKTLQHWPHIVRVVDANTRNVVSAERTYRRMWDGRTLDTKPGLYTQYRRLLSRDKSLMKKLRKNERPDSVQSAILRRYMVDLTQSFMMPLERYLSSLLPLRKDMSPFKVNTFSIVFFSLPQTLMILMLSSHSYFSLHSLTDLCQITQVNNFQAVPQIKPFTPNDFLSGLDDADPSLTCGVKGDWIGLYRKFISSANFEGWLRCRQKDVDRQLRATHLEVLCNADFSAGMLSERHEVEVVDLVLKLCERIRELDRASFSEVRLRLQSQLATILQSVNDELKSVLLSNGVLRDCVN